MTKPIVASHGFAKAPVPYFHFSSNFVACWRIMQRYHCTWQTAPWHTRCYWNGRPPHSNPERVIVAHHCFASLPCLEATWILREITDQTVFLGCMVGEVTLGEWVHLSFMFLHHQVGCNSKYKFILVSMPSTRIPFHWTILSAVWREYHQTL